MVSFKFAALLLASTVAAAPAAVASESIYDLCLKDIDNIDSNVRILIDQMKTYTAGIENTRAPLDTLAKVSEALASGVAHSALLPPLSHAQALGIIHHVNSTLTVDNPIAIDLVIAKRPEFQKTHLDVFLSPVFTGLLAGHESFTFNVGDKTPPDLYLTGLSVTSPISKAIAKGIAAYAGVPTQ
ncbi:hypothetical protein VHEMI06612 [[Torrubiella] hemipterigena]|uniref:Cell wall galactomannoprotein n=1 Tax=[Torrubiella] hemipterigena TaxID=1531966 RepID=A0A0A1TJV5_9HYPO|nr:hypothetical protein VHEMI06612 [[Torrubiella] hemipterigena]